MASYEHLPIYKSALDLTVHLEKVVAGCSRYHKYTLGTEIGIETPEISRWSMPANAAQPKYAALDT